MIRVLKAVLILTAVTAGICLLLEAGARLYLRLRDGYWPRTLVSMLYAGRENSNRIYRAHPFLGTAPREGTSTTASGRRMSFNSRGYRSPERPVTKPPGVLRIVTAGGSTTFDVGAPNDQASWPWQLETDLTRSGNPAEVWNAGFPGWTSEENVIALAIRDLDLHPDLLVLYQGINDLQPAAQVPFHPQYEGTHVRLSQQALGITDTPLPWYQRSVFLEHVLPAAQRWVGLVAPPAAEPALADVPEAALAVFERNVRSFIAVGRSGGARTLLVTQPMRLRAGTPLDAVILQGWIPGLAPATAVRDLERYNDVLRRVAASGDADLADAARDVPWTDADFADPMHFAPAGSTKLAAYLTDRITASVQYRNKSGP